jgi:TonB family protein
MARLQGSVRVEIKVGADGKVVSATATGNDRLLERASEENIRQWRFCPASSAQESVRTQTVTYVYRLEGREEYYDPPPRVVLDLPEKVEITSHPPEPQP